MATRAFDGTLLCMNSLRLLAFDLDDTLLRPDHQLSPRAISALTQWHERGVIVALASGRMLANMLPVAARLPFAPAMVSYNGALVHLHAEDETPFYHRPVPAAASQRVIKWAHERDLHLHFYENDQLYTNRIDDWKARVYREHTGANLIYEPDFERFYGHEATKLLIADDAERIEELMIEAREDFRDELTITRSRPIYLEFLHPQVDKGAGVRALCEHLGIEMENVGAFGDSYNDLEMLQSVGTVVVVENGFPAAKALAERICPPNSEDGVAQVLEEWLRNRVPQRV